MSRRIELLVFGLALAALVLAQLAATRTFDLFTHPLWLDETITYLIANDPSFTHAIRAIHGGVETNPPTLYLLLWPLARLAGGLNEIGLRVVSLASVWLAVVGAYAICRRSFARAPSVAGALVLGAHPLVVEQAFEARFYGPWLAVTVWYVYILLESFDRGPAIAGRSLLAIVLATIHWFGVVTLVVIELADRIVNRDRLRRSIPLLCGLLAAATCIPFLLGQREGLSVKTWVDAPTLSAVKKMLVHLFGTPAMIVIVFAWWTRVLTPPPRTRGEGRGEGPAPDRPEGAALIVFSAPFILFPLLVIFSYIVQPALVDRYLIVTIAPLSVVAATMLDRAPRWLSVATIVLLMIVAAAELQGPAKSGRGLRRDLDKMLASIDAASDQASIVFKRRHEMYPLLRLRPAILRRSALLDFNADPAGVGPMARYERDMGRKVARFYEPFRLTSPDELRSATFLLVCAPEEIEQFKSLVGDHDLRPRGEILYESIPAPQR